MKIGCNSSPLILSEGFENDGSVMGMGNVAALMMAEHLRDTVYKNKILAVVRELSSNAIDEHVKYNVERPVEIGLRQNGEELEFYVRDYAKGLSDADIRNVFGPYGESTKNQDNKNIGGYGIGSKSPFCYNKDSFFVISHFEGIATTYTCVLGGNDQGISVGRIFEISQEPTTETGLDVYMNIQKSDIFNFNKEMENFITYSPHKIRGVLGSGNIIEPKEPTAIKNVEGVQLRFYESDTPKVYLQMGGVKYSDLIVPSKATLKEKTCLVVDIPIGAMSVVLSREEFQTTTSNTNYLNKLNSILDSFSKEDLKKFYSFTPEEIVSQGSLRTFSNEFFSIKITDLFPNIKQIIHNLSSIKNSFDSSVPDVLDRIKGKIVIVSIPNNAATNYWRAKVGSFYKGKKQNCLLLGEHFLNDSSPEAVAFLGNFSVISARKLPYVKVPTGATYSKDKCSVIFINRRNIGRKSPLELHNYMRREFGRPQAADEAEAILQNKETKNNLRHRDDLRSISIGDKALYGITKAYPVATSVAFLQSMETLGFINVNSDEWRKISNDMNAKEAQERAEAESRNLARSIGVIFNERTVSAIKKTRHAKRMIDRFTKLTKESSLRGKVLANSKDKYSGFISNKYTREELRSILKLS